MAAGDELSARFPTLDQFALLHDQGNHFDFDASEKPPSPSSQQLLGQPVERSAGEALSAVSTPPISRPVSTRPKSVTQLASPPVEGNNLYQAISIPTKPEMSRAQAIISNNPELCAISSSKPSYVLTGTMRSSSPPLTRPLEAEPTAPPPPSIGHLRPRASQGNLTGVSKLLPQAALGYLSSSSRPSLEYSRPEAGELAADVSSLSSFGAKSRPGSTMMSTNDESDWLSGRDSKACLSLPSYVVNNNNSPRLIGMGDNSDGTANMVSNVDFLRSMEGPDGKKREKRLKHGRRSSNLSLSGTKSILMGKFGEAFKRFEGGGGGNSQDKTARNRPPRPHQELERQQILTPIAGSEAADDRSDDGSMDNMDSMTPEMRRELERMQLDDEERRVEAAKNEYHHRLMQKDMSHLPLLGGLPKRIGGVSRAVSIQNRVQSLLEDSMAVAVPRTAQGYGKYTDVAPPPSDSPETKRQSFSLRAGSGSGGAEPSKPAIASSLSLPSSSSSSSSLSAVPLAVPIKSTSSGRPPAPHKPPHLANTVLAGGRPASPTMAKSGGDVVCTPGKDEYVRDFTKRFPSLGTMEMAERGLGSTGRGK